MRDYADQIARLRECASNNYEVHSKCGAYLSGVCAKTRDIRMQDAADAIEELLRIGAKMHTWIFLNTADEQAAYDEIGLTDEQNALFGYSGQMILKAEPSKEEHTDEP